MTSQIAEMIRTYLEEVKVDQHGLLEMLKKAFSDVKRGRPK
jgi:hypothetical protein